MPHSATNHAASHATHHDTDMNADISADINVDSAAAGKPLPTRERTELKAATCLVNGERALRNRGRA